MVIVGDLAFQLLVLVSHQLAPDAFRFFQFREVSVFALLFVPVAGLLVGLAIVRFYDTIGPDAAHIALDAPVLDDPIETILHTLIVLREELLLSLLVEPKHLLLRLLVGPLLGLGLAVDAQVKLFYAGVVCVVVLRGLVRHAVDVDVARGQPLYFGGLPAEIGWAAVWGVGSNTLEGMALCIANMATENSCQLIQEVEELVPIGTVLVAAQIRELVLKTADDRLHLAARPALVRQLVLLLLRAIQLVLRHPHPPQEIAAALLVLVFAAQPERRDQLS